MSTQNITVPQVGTYQKIVCLMNHCSSRLCHGGKEVCAKLFLYVVAAMIMFVIGVAANNTMDALGDLAIAKLNDAKPLPDLTATTLLAQYPQPVPAGANYCGSLIVSVATDRSLYLNQEETGTLNNTAPLTARLRI